MDNKYGLLKASSLMLIAMVNFSAHAVVKYDFTGGAVIADRILDNTLPQNPRVTTNPLASPFTASLSFSNPLAPNTTTVIDAEYGGFDHLTGAPQGGVLNFSADASIFFNGVAANSIRSGEANEYVAGVGGDTVSLFRYSTVTGSVTTDNLGNISAWMLDFTLWELVGGTGFVCTGPACVADISLAAVDLLLSIKSGPATPLSLDYVELNGIPGAGTENISFFDAAFFDNGAIRGTGYSGSQGSWSSDQTPNVPEPSALSLILFSGLALAKKKFI